MAIKPPSNSNVLKPAVLKPVASKPAASKPASKPIVLKPAAKTTTGYKAQSSAVKGAKPAAKKFADSTTRGFAGSWAKSNTAKGKGK